MGSQDSVELHRVSDYEAASPTLIEGLPGEGLVASIAVDQIADQLGLDHYGSLRSEAFPPVASFEDGRVQDTVRVYAGNDPEVMTLQSDAPIPPEAFSGLSDCVLEDLSEQFERAIFLAGAPAQTDEQRGNVTAAATTAALKDELVDHGIPLAEDAGAVSGVTGALVTACHHTDVKAALLLVRVDPRLPDPGAAKAVIENALEPLVDFEIDTQPLQEQAEQIQEQKQQLAQQLQQLQQGGEEEPMQAQNMFQ